MIKGGKTLNTYWEKKFTQVFLDQKHPVNNPAESVSKDLCLKRNFSKK